MNPNQIKVSYFQSVWDNEPKTISFQDFLDGFSYNEHIVKRIRKGRIDLKSKLPAITPTGEFKGGRTGEWFPNGFASFDIDYVEDMTKTREIVKSLPWVYYLGTSVSGKGLWGLVRFWDSNQYVYHYAAMIQNFIDAGIHNVDPSTCDVTRLRFVSMLDGSEYLNESAEVFSQFKYDMIKTRDGKRPDIWINHKFKFRRDDIQKIRQFNEAHTCEDLLTECGWSINGGNHRGQVHALRPGGSKSTSGNIKNNLFWCFTASTELEPNKLYRPFDLYVTLMHGDDVEAAVFSL